MTMAGKPKQHPVDGGWMTVAQAADMLGIIPKQICQLMSKHSCGLQVAVNMVRQNMALGGQGRSDRHMVDGRWVTVNQLVEQLGTKPTNLRSWSYRHRDSEGRPATMQAVADAYRAGVHRGGGKPVQHRVNGRDMTVAQVAEKYGKSVNGVRMRMSRKKCSLAACVRYYETKRCRQEEKRATQAKKEIMRILGY